MTKMALLPRWEWMAAPWCAYICYRMIIVERDVEIERKVSLTVFIFPSKRTSTSRALLRKMPLGIPWLHFLDQQPQSQFKLEFWNEDI